MQFICNFVKEIVPLKRFYALVSSSDCIKRRQWPFAFICMVVFDIWPFHKLKRIALGLTVGRRTLNIGTK